MKKIVKLLTIILVIGSIFSCSKKEKEEEKFVRPVKYQEVGYLGGKKIRTFSGTAQTDKIIGLSFRNNGIITVFDIKLGQRVKKGQLLAKLDNVQARLNYETAVSRMNSAESQMNTAKLNYDRVRSLYEKGSASLSDFEAAKNSYKTAQESYESSKRTVALQKEQISYGFIYAPSAGIISNVNAELDENVNAGLTIATLNVGSNMEISLGIPESVINVVKPGMNVDVDFPSLPDESFKGKVSEVSPAVDATSATYPVLVMIIDPSDQIKTGMSATVTFRFENNQNIETNIIVPANAVGEDSEGNFVFLIQDKGKTAEVKKQKVNIGKLTADGFEILSGLKAGQKIATAGLQTLVDGQEVKLQ